MWIRLTNRLSFQLFPSCRLFMLFSKFAIVQYITLAQGARRRPFTQQAGVRFLKWVLLFFIVIQNSPNLKGKLHPLGKVGRQRDLVYDKLSISEVLQGQVPSTSSYKFSMKLAFENCYFTMLKWLNFDDRFESQILQGNFDPLNQLLHLNLLGGI